MEICRVRALERRFAFLSRVLKFVLGIEVDEKNTRRRDKILRRLCLIKVDQTAVGCFQDPNRLIHVNVSKLYNHFSSVHLQNTETARKSQKFCLGSEHVSELRELFSHLISSRF